MDDGSGYFSSIATNLISSAIAFLSGIILSRSKNIIKRLMMPKFLKYLHSSEILLVVGEHKNFDLYDSAGMLGTGDARALGEIQGWLLTQGIKKFRIIHAADFSAEDFKCNLILIGGADANSISRTCLESSQGSTSLRFGNPDIHEVSIFGISQYIPYYEDSRFIDYCALLFLDSPFYSNRKILLICGSFGHGTWSGAICCSNSRNFKTFPTRRKNFEIVLKCEVRNNYPLNINIIEVNGTKCM